jgi:hypothetical protein
MKLVVTPFPFFSEHNCHVVKAIASLPDVKVAAVTHDPETLLPPEYRDVLCGHWRVQELRDIGQLRWAVQELSARHGPVHQLFSPIEHLQTVCARLRTELGIRGMSVEATQNFRDKALMKDLLRGAGIPCARHRRACSEHDAWAFAGEVGFPMVVKPVEGAASQETFKVDDADGLRRALDVLHPSAHAQVILEEFLTGQEHSCDSFWLNGKRLFHTINNYFPSCLDVMRNPWMQWVVVLPREVHDPGFDDIRAASLEAHRVLGMGTGMSHTEWFRRPDGSLAISEIGARPPGAQFTTIVSRSSDFDALRAWAGLLVYEEFDTPVQKYSAGCCYLRGQGQGQCVRAVHGWDEVQAKIGHLLTDVKLPAPGAPKSVTYEGEGYLIARHPETKVVEDALKYAVSVIRVELG